MVSPLFAGVRRLGQSPIFQEEEQPGDDRRHAAAPSDRHTGGAFDMGNLGTSPDFLLV